MAQIEKKVTLPILGYYDEKIKDWVVNQIDNTAQADWAETDEFSSSYIKNKPENLVTGANLEFKRLNEEGNEDNTIDSISIVIDGNVVNKFFSSHDRIQANVSFIASEVKTFFEDAGITPDTYDGSTWTEEIMSIANMTAENGPYLVFITNNAEDAAIHAHVKSMKNALSNYATAQYVDEKDKNNVKYNNNNVEFKNHAVVPFGSGLYGTSPDLGWTLLAAVKGYNLETEEKFIQSEFGSASLHTNINSKDRPTIETANGKEDIAYLSDIENIDIIDDEAAAADKTYSSQKIDSLLEDKQEKVDGVIATNENLSMDRIVEESNQMRLKVGEDIVATFPAPKLMFTPQTSFVAKEIKSFYEELGLVPETVNGYDFGSSSDPSKGDINYFIEANGPYLVFTKMDVMEPLNLNGGNVILLKEIMPIKLANPEALTIQFNGVSLDTYDGSEAKIINVQAATQEYVQQLISTINTASYQIVEELPTDDIDTNNIYLVLASKTEEKNIYDEYIYVNNDWEKIGSTALDLSGYATKEYVDELDKNNVKYTSDNNVELKNHMVVPFGSGVYGNSPKNGWVNLAAVKGYNLDTEEEIIQSELGSTAIHMALNSKDRPTVDTAKGQEDLAYLSDIEKEVFYIQIPIRTLRDKVYTQEEILNWFGVKDIPELKTKITRNYLPILKYGITLSYNPHFYKMIVEYLAFESANQIKLVFSGLNTSNDDASKYEIIINLDGTIIEGNSNVKLSQLKLIDEETLRTEIENATQLEII